MATDDYGDWRRAAQVVGLVPAVELLTAAGVGGGWLGRETGRWETGRDGWVDWMWMGCTGGGGPLGLAKPTVTSSANVYFSVCWEAGAQPAAAVVALWVS